MQLLLVAVVTVCAVAVVAVVTVVGAAVVANVIAIGDILDTVGDVVMCVVKSLWLLHVLTYSIV